MGLVTEIRLCGIQIVISCYMYFLQFPTQNDWYSNSSYHLGKSEELFLRHCGKIMNCIIM